LYVCVVSDDRCPNPDDRDDAECVLRREADECFVPVGRRSLLEISPLSVFAGEARRQGAPAVATDERRLAPSRL